MFFLPVELSCHFLKIALGGNLNKVKSGIASLGKVKFGIDLFLAGVGVLA